MISLLWCLVTRNRAVGRRLVDPATGERDRR
ncbi:hypothetical protein QF048_006719 [Streptomyces sp. W4I9-2]|nr:hypothetical protein [Streptomyces sp. W4I9-2]